MKLSDYTKDYYEFSGKASDITRNLAFAGIALVWILKGGTATTLRIQHELLIPLALFVLCLGFDLLQYIAATCVWGIFQWYQERKLNDLKEDPDLTASSWLKLPQITFFIFKLITLFYAYYSIAEYVWPMLYQNKG